MGGFGRPFFRMVNRSRATTFIPCDWTGLGPEVERCAFEREAAAAGARRVAGVDEAGRGPLAGPIVAAAVILAYPVDGLDDSKRLTPARRERLFAAVTAGDHAYALSIVSPEAIDTHGIQTANYTAMNDAIARLDPQPDLALVDGFTIPGCAVPHLRIVKGDQRSCSIAAASIVAKVTRDRMLRELDARYPGYGFAEHKGYGTRAHREAIERLGPCPAHRRSFAPFSTTKTTLFFNEDMRTESQ